MLFGNSKLEKELEQKNELIDRLHKRETKLIEELDKRSKTKEVEVKELKRKLELQTIELTSMHKKFEHVSSELEQSLSNLERISNTDTLTGAYNKRYFYDVAESIISIAKREKQPLCLAIMDIDQFDEINDRYGYKVGDNLIQAFVHKIFLRESDLLVRFSEKEFVMLFPNTYLEHAMVALEKIRKEINSSVFIQNLQVTLSIGVHEYVSSKDNINTVINTVKSTLQNAEKNSINKC